VCCGAFCAELWIITRGVKFRVFFMSSLFFFLFEAKKKKRRFFTLKTHLWAKVSLSLFISGTARARRTGGGGEEEEEEEEERKSSSSSSSEAFIVDEV
jgi:hypothetical protein